MKTKEEIEREIEETKAKLNKLERDLEDTVPLAVGQIWRQYRGGYYIVTEVFKDAMSASKLLVLINLCSGLAWNSFTGGFGGGTDKDFQFISSNPEGVVKIIPPKG